jgi:protein-S-isoprenylcysteine O-methyltransferase Ste14
MNLKLPDAVAAIRADRARLRRVQKRRKDWLRGVIGAGALLLLFVASRWPDDSMIHEAFEEIGLVLILACIAGRAWCILYIGGRKTNELVQLGPYSISRNPLYLFSFVGALGIGLQSGSLVIGLLCLAMAMAVFVPVVQKEEEVLARSFGEEFAAYRALVPRFGPRLSTWRDAESVSFAPTLLYTTVRDSLVFACAYPIFELIGMLQDLGYIPVLLRLP